MKVGVLATTMFALLIGFPIASFAGLLPDFDGDGVADVSDNCDKVAQTAAQFCDTDQDGYGNFCDCDLNNSALPTVACTGGDLALWKAAAAASPQVNFNADHNCSGAMTGADLALWKLRAANAATQVSSGLPCKGTIPCP